MVMKLNIPQVTTAERNSIVTAKNGAVVYNTDTMSFDFTSDGAATWRSIDLQYTFDHSADGSITIAPNKSLKVNGLDGVVDPSRLDFFTPTNSNGETVSDIFISGNDSSNNSSYYSGITSSISDSTASSHAGQLTFYVASLGALNGFFVLNGSPRVAQLYLLLNMQFNNIINVATLYCNTLNSTSISQNSIVGTDIDNNLVPVTLTGAVTNSGLVTTIAVDPGQNVQYILTLDIDMDIALQGNNIVSDNNSDYTINLTLNDNFPVGGLFTVYQTVSTVIVQAVSGVTLNGGDGDNIKMTAGQSNTYCKIGANEWTTLLPTFSSGVGISISNNFNKFTFSSSLPVSSSSVYTPTFSTQAASGTFSNIISCYSATNTNSSSICNVSCKMSYIPSAVVSAFRVSVPIGGLFTGTNKAVLNGGSMYDNATGAITSVLRDITTLNGVNYVVISVNSPAGALGVLNIVNFSFSYIIP
jgi:hypothetical protein